MLAKADNGLHSATLMDGITQREYYSSATGFGALIIFCTHSDNYKLLGEGSKINTYVGGVYQQTTSGLSVTNQVSHDAPQKPQLTFINALFGM